VALGWGDNSWGDYGWGGAIPLTGALANGNVGTLGVSDVEVALTGTSASGVVGQVVQTKIAGLTGVESSGLAGTVIPNIDTSTLAGWGYNTWGSEGWGGIFPRGVGASGFTGTVVQGKTDYPTSVLSSGNVGTAVSNLSVSLFGSYAYGLTNLNNSEKDAALTSTTASGVLGNLGVGNRDIALSGVGAFSELGVLVDGIGSVLSGVVVSGQVGTVVWGKTVYPTGVVASGAVGTLVQNRTVALTGSGAIGAAGTIGYRYWSVINDVQNPNWVVITTF
jgi:hypothetical protein